MNKIVRIVAVRSFLILLLLALPMTLTAMGNSEKTYGESLDEEFTAIAEALESGEIDMETAIEQLHDLRTGFGREDNEDYQAMERLLTAVREQTMTTEQARERLHQLDEYAENEEPLRTQTMTTEQTREQTSTGEKAQDGGSAPEGSSGGQASGGSNSGSGNRNN